VQNKIIIIIITTTFKSHHRSLPSIMEILGCMAYVL
jgi:hypothetical protein